MRLDTPSATGLLYAFLAVAAFSLTLPLTRIAVGDLPPDFVGTGRVVLAGVFALGLLVITRQPLPARRHWPGLTLVALGVSLVFPWLSAWALLHLPASHAAITLGLLPLLTALMARLRAGERPSLGFWFAGLLGSLGVLAFVLGGETPALHGADALLLISVVLGAVGYAEGGRLARDIGGWQTISWSLVIAAPIVAVPFLLSVPNAIEAIPLRAWLSLAYLGLISQWLAFFAWYQGMARAGIAHSAQVQLLQVFLTLVAAAVLLHEPIPGKTLLFALWVVGCVVMGRLASRRTAFTRTSTLGERS